MDPNSNPLGATPAPAPAPAPEPTMPTDHTMAAAPAAPIDPAAPADPAMADLGNLANELNNYNPAMDPAAPTTDPAPVANPNTADLNMAADPMTPATDPNIATAVAANPTVNPAGLAAPAVPASPFDNVAPIAPENPTDMAPINNDINPIATPGMSATPGMPTTPDLSTTPAAPATPGITPTDTPDLNAFAAAANSPVAAPSADLAAVSTVSAAPNGAQNADLGYGQNTDPNLAGQPAPMSNGPAPTSFVGDPNLGSQDPNLAGQPADPDALIGRPRAAAPVPGSIGSAKSYADIQRMESERAAKAAAAAAAKQNGKKKISPTTIIIAAAAVVILIIALIVFLVSSNSGSSTPTPTPSPAPVTYEPEKTTLICQIDMQPGEFAGMPGVLSAKRQNAFGFADDELNSLKTEQIYYMDSSQAALDAKNGYDSEHPTANKPAKGLSGNSSKKDDETTDKTADDKSADAEKTDQSEDTDERAALESISTTAAGATYTFTRFVNEDNIEDWLDSSFYEDEEYGLKSNKPNATRTIEDFKDAQNGLGYNCTITSGE